MSPLTAIVGSLSPPQRAAAMHRDGPLLVIAGAGSGKTRTATHRLACLLASGVAPASVLCITFTNKAAREMRQRALDLVGPLAGKVLIRTFHAAAMVLLRECLHQYPQCGRDPGFTIADPAMQLALVKEAVAERDLDPKSHRPETFLWRISRYKNEMADAQALLWRQASNAWMNWERVKALIAQTDRFANRMTAEIWQRYEEKLVLNNLLDFDDLINLLVRILGETPAVRAGFQRRFQYIQVDEFQDTNVAQLQLVKMLAGERRNVMAVGDDSQSIYSWRSADLRCILEYEQEFPGAHTITLEQNYRSTAVILQAANRLIAHNTGQRPKTLFTTAAPGQPICRHEADSADDEARFVVDEIQRLVATGRRPGEIAVLMRTNAQSRVFEEHLRAAALPYQVVGGPRFYDRREVQDALAYLRLLGNPRDTLSLERVVNAPRRGLGERGLQKVLGLAGRRQVDLMAALNLAATEGVLTAQAAAAAQQLHNLFRRSRGRLEALRESAPSSPHTSGSVAAEAARELLRESGFLPALTQEDRQEQGQRVENVQALLASLAKQRAAAGAAPLEALGSFLERIVLADAQDDDRGGEAVRLLTIHAAKGLEFPIVFVVGMEQGVLPNERALAEGGLEEERRLCYVAITRARELLYLTSARIRRAQGEFAVTTPSQFLTEALGV